MKKLVMLLLLLSGHRGQTIHLLEVRNMSLSFSRATFQLGEPLKQQRPGKHVKELAFKGYAPDHRLCMVTAERISKTGRDDLRDGPTTYPYM